MEGLTTAGMAQYLVEQLSGDRLQVSSPTISPEEVKRAEFALAQAAAKAGDGPASIPIVQTSTEGATAAAGGNGRTLASEAQAEAEQLLAGVGNLSDGEVDSLLRRIADEDAISVADGQEVKLQAKAED